MREATSAGARIDAPTHVFHECLISPTAHKSTIRIFKHTSRTEDTNSHAVTFQSSNLFVRIFSTNLILHTCGCMYPHSHPHPKPCLVDRRASTAAHYCVTLYTLCVHCPLQTPDCCESHHCSPVLVNELAIPPASMRPHDWRERMAVTDFSSPRVEE